MQSSEYWKQRMVLLEEAMLKKGEVYLGDLDEQYRKTSTNIEREISKWYNRFALNNNISMAEAKKLLTSKELKEFKWDVKDYIKYGKENAMNPIWMKELENASARVHISRLESLRVQMQQQVEVLYGNQTDDIDDLMRKIYQEGYYHTAYEVQKGFNVGYSLQAINKNQLDKIINKPWTLDGKTFSDRLWTNKQLLVGNLQTYLTQSVITGKPPDEIIKVISKQLGTDKKKAGRLIMTESAAFASVSQKDAYIDLDVEKYEIVATLDTQTSEICRDLDGRVFDMKDYEIAATAPPFHAWCRTTTVPSFDDEFSLGERVARGLDGKTYYVPSDMKYKDWYNKHIESNEIQQIRAKIKAIGFTGEISIPSKKIDTNMLSFDDRHILDRKHNVSMDEAKSFIEDAVFSSTRWNGKFVNFYGYEGTTYVNMDLKEIRTAFKANEYDKKTISALEVLRKYGR